MDSIEGMLFPSSEQRDLYMCIKPEFQVALTNQAYTITMAKGEHMKGFRKIATIVLVWATASSTLIASTPYYVCRCPDGAQKTHHVGTVAPESSCCSSNCCTAGTKEQTCCQSAKKQRVARLARESRATETQRRSDGPTVGHAPCQKTLVQPEERSVCRTEADAAESAATLLPAALPLVTAIFEMNVATTPPFPRFARGGVGGLPPIDLVTVFQRLTI